MTPENAEKKAIKEYLSLIGCFNFPLLAGLGAVPGLPDRFAVWRGRVYAIEIKAPGGKQSDKQKIFQDNWEAQGQTYVLGGIDEVMKIIKR